MSRLGARGALSCDGPEGGELAAVTIVVNGHNDEAPEHYRVHVVEKMAHVQRYGNEIIEITGTGNDSSRTGRGPRSAGGKVSLT